MKPERICLVGGGSLTHVIAGWLSRQGMSVNILTRRPDAWAKSLTISTPKEEFTAPLSTVSNNPADVIPEADVVLLTVPGTANAGELRTIKPYLRPDTLVGGVFCSSGFFFEAHKILSPKQPLWGLQRVPFIARQTEYGHRARILGNRPDLKVAFENVEPTECLEFAHWLGKAFNCEVNIMNSYLEVSITNSNPILHTGRLYSMFADWDENQRSNHNILFYEEWTTDSAQTIIDMDAELFNLLSKLPVNHDYLLPLLTYYESCDAESLCRKISSIAAFKGITSPMLQDEHGWYPDYTSRYFTEDFGHSLRYIYELAREHNVSTPTINKVYEWGLTHINS